MLRPMMHPRGISALPMGLPGSPNLGPNQIILETNVSHRIPDKIPCQSLSGRPFHFLPWYSHMSPCMGSGRGCDPWKCHTHTRNGWEGTLLLGIELGRRSVLQHCRVSGDQTSGLVRLHDRHCTLESFLAAVNTIQCTRCRARWVCPS